MVGALVDVANDPDVVIEPDWWWWSGFDRREAGLGIARAQAAQTLPVDALLESIVQADFGDGRLDDDLASGVCQDKIEVLLYFLVLPCGCAHNDDTRFGD
jgi:hypothetical protein